MTLEEFEQTNYNTSLQLINKGVFLAKRQEGKYIVFLYKVYGFYVEVFYLPKYSHLAGMRAFSEHDSEKLGAYRRGGIPLVVLTTAIQEQWETRRAKEN